VTVHFEIIFKPCQRLHPFDQKGDLHYSHVLSSFVCAKGTLILVREPQQRPDSFVLLFPFAKSSLYLASDMCSGLNLEVTLME
jgi:hypothetical protein